MKGHTMLENYINHRVKIYTLGSADFTGEFLGFAEDSLGWAILQTPNYKTIFIDPESVVAFLSLEEDLPE